MDKLLDAYDLPKLSQDNMNKSNIFMISNSPKAVIVSQQRNLKLDRFTTEFYQIFKEKLTPMLIKPFCKMERRNTIKLIL
jgi:hypothetical protein